MNIQLSRRRFLTGVGLVIAAPAIVRASSLMPVRMITPNDTSFWCTSHKEFVFEVEYDIKLGSWATVVHRLAS